VLLIHGFTGSPVEMRPFGDALAKAGYTVLAPLLPGHGSQPEDMNRVRWQEWAAAVEVEYHRLAGHAAQIFVSGLSMGGLLALHLAAQQATVAGLLLFSPALHVFDRRLFLAGIGRRVWSTRPKSATAATDPVDPQALDRIWSYDVHPVGGAHQLWLLKRQVRRELAQVRQPLLVIQGRQDTAVRPDSPVDLLARVGSADKQLVWLDHSGHVVTVDADRERAFALCLEWLSSRAPA